jgi:glycosyltransferase involved in cell wall biosynthesis
VIEPDSYLIFDINQPHTVIDKITEAIELLNNSGIRKRLLDYAETFSPDAMVGAYLDLYNAALKAAIRRAPAVA